MPRFAAPLLICAALMPACRRSDSDTSVEPALIFFNPAAGAKGVPLHLPAAGTLPGDLPTLDPAGNIGPTGVFDGGLPVHGVFQPPFFCHQCHSVPDIWDSFMGTMMANSARDPLFRSEFSIAVAGMEFLKNQGVTTKGGELAADFCIRCHMPNAWQGGRSGFEGDGVATAFTPGVYGPSHSMDLEGVSCDVCHRAVDFFPNVSPTADVVAGQPDTAQLVFATTLTKRGPYPGGIATSWAGTTAYGALVPPETETPQPVVPHIDGVQDGTAVSPAHNTEKSEFHLKSEICGSCHNITNPLSGHAVERTYTEWLNSDFSMEGTPGAMTCQACHEGQQPNTIVCILGPPFTKLRLRFAKHEFTGGNAWIPQILKAMYPGLDAPWQAAGTNYAGLTYGGPAGRDALWDATTARAFAMLKSAAEIDLTAEEISPNVIRARVKITNLSGHKLPTGYVEGRQMWVRIRALDAGGLPFFESGLLDANNALIRDANLKVYEGVHALDYPEIGLTGPSFHFIMNNIILKDNRIPPKGARIIRGMGGTDGYDPQNAPWPIGGLYPDGQHWDDTVYDIVVPTNRVRPLKIAVTVFYQTTSWEYLQFLVNGGDSRMSTLPHPDAAILLALWTGGTPSPAVPVGTVGPTSTQDPASPTPDQSAMVTIGAPPPTRKKSKDCGAVGMEGLFFVFVVAWIRRRVAR